MRQYIAPLRRLLAAIVILVLLSNSVSPAVAVAGAVVWWYRSDESSLSFSELAGTIGDRVRTHQSAQAERARQAERERRAAREREREQRRVQALADSRKNQGTKGPVKLPRIDQPPPPPVDTITTEKFHLTGEVSGTQVIPISTGADNQEWDAKHLVGQKVQVALMASDGKLLGEPQEVTVSSERNVVVQLHKRMFEVEKQESSRTFTVKRLIPRTGGGISGKKSANGTAPANPARTPDSPSSESQTPLPETSTVLTVRPLIAAVQVTLPAQLAEEYEIEQSATQPFPDLAPNHLKVQGEPKIQQRTSSVPQTNGLVRIASSRWFVPTTASSQKGQAKVQNPKQKPKPGSKLPAPTQSRTQTVTREFDVAYAYQVAPEPLKPVVLRRSVADFIIKGPEGLQLELGGQKVGRETYRDGAYRFRKPLGDFPDTPFFATANRELTGGVQESVVALPARSQVKPYAPNEVSAPPLRLTKLNSIALGPRTVTRAKPDDAAQLDLACLNRIFPDWNSVAFEGLPNIAKEKKQGRIIEPEIKNDKGRYGKWYVYDESKVWVNLREIGFRKIVVDGVRLVGEKAGGFGGVRVGMKRSDVHDALGEGDPASPGTVDLHREEFKGPIKEIPVLLEPADESYLDNGLRIKYENDQVKWMEVRRPAPLLLQGTIAFIPPQPKRFYVRDTKEEDGISARGYLQSLLRGVPIARFANSLDDADYALTPNVSVSGEVDLVDHPIEEKVPDLDKNGNRQFDKDGKVKMKKQYRTVHRDEVYRVRTHMTCGIERVNEDGSTSRLSTISALAIGSTPGPSSHEATDRPIQIREVDKPEFKRRYAAVPTNARGDLLNAWFDLCNVQGRVLSIDHRKNELTVNLGSDLGISPKGTAEGGELDLFVPTGDVRSYYFAHPDTGQIYIPVKASVGDDPARWTFEQPKISTYDNPDRPRQISGDEAGKLKALGEKISGWAEVQSVTRESCVVALKTKKSVLEGGKTTDDWRALARVPDPANAVVYVRVRVKRGDAR